MKHLLERAKYLLCCHITSSMRVKGKLKNKPYWFIDITVVIIQSHHIGGYIFRIVTLATIPFCYYLLVKESVRADIRFIIRHINYDL